MALIFPFVCLYTASAQRHQREAQTLDQSLDVPVQVDVKESQSAARGFSGAHQSIR